MEGRKTRLPLIGMPMYCADCRRLLVQFHENGTMDISGRVELRGSAEGFQDEDGNVVTPDALVVTQAICMRRTCTAKRWLRETKNQIRRKA